jgi:hypothetical protein
VTEGKPAAFMKKHTCSRRLELVPYMREWPVNTKKGASWTTLPLQLACSSHVKNSFKNPSWNGNWCWFISLHQCQLPLLLLLLLL